MIDRQKKRVLFFFAVLIFILPSVFGIKQLKGIACRSVHLAYQAPEGVKFYIEVTVDKSSSGTYFMACGFRMGYFGIQELWNGKKIILFSIWDSGKQNNPNAVAKERRVRVLFKDPKVRVKRFGNEGTGGQSFFDYNWKLGIKYKFMVTAKSLGKRTAFSAFFFIPETKKWKHLVTFDTLAGGKLLKGYYSFIEDFQRNRISATKVRQAHFGNGWVMDGKGKWHELTKARFTGDGNPVMNIDAGASGNSFFLVTGGDTTNSHIPLWKYIHLKASGKKKPTGLPPESKSVKVSNNPSGAAPKSSENKLKKNSK